MSKFPVAVGAALLVPPLLALAPVEPAIAQTISQPVGCIAGIDCSAKSLSYPNGTKVTDTANGSLSISNSSGGLTAAITAGSGGALFTSGNTFSGGSMIAAAPSGLSWNGRSVMISPNDGTITLLNNANTSFTALQFGGQTNSFAEIKRSGAALNLRLADDSGDAAITTAGVTASSTVTAPNFVISNNGTVLNDVGNGALRLCNSGVSNCATLSATTANAAPTLQLGAFDAASPVTQTLAVQSVAAGTANTAGANFTIAGSKGTGSGSGGSIVFQVAPAGSTGSAQNALATAMTIASDKSVTAQGAITSNGTITANSGNITAAFSLIAGAGAVWPNGISKTQITAPTDGVLQFQKAAGSGAQLVVSGLGSCNSAATGSRSMVTDATAAALGNFGSAVTGGGSNTVPVYCDGASWKIG